MNWTLDNQWQNQQPWVAPDVEAARIKHHTVPKIELAVWVVMGLAASLVVLRMYYHIFRGRRRLWSDDYFLIAALVFLIGNGIAIREWVPYKLEPNVTTTAPSGMVLSGSLMGLFNSFALALSKTSLCITFIRLTTGWWKSSLGLSIFVINILFAVQAWSYWVQDCDSPSEPYRVQTDMQGCVTFESITSFRLTVQILSCALDAYFTFLPWKIVRSLELKRFEKIGLAIAMSFGFASLTCGLERMVILIRLASETYEYQPLYSVGGFLYNFFEPGFSIIAACMPVTRKIFMDVIRWKRNTPASGWLAARYKRRDTPSVLPITGFPGRSAFESQSTSDRTDTTLVRTTTPTMPATPLSARTYCTYDKAVYPQVLSEKLDDLPRAA
ncbi:hypothetical protein F4678DRAFT_455223 [Xylaria arbuscula]|nr:hypothetical protein F4678DRAFT_455223 [Xylaria arbuscula]